MHILRYKITTFVFFFYLCSACFSQDYIVEIMGDIHKKEISLENDKFAIVESIYKWKDSNGQYGNGFCYGSIKTEEDDIDLYNICESKDSENEKFWTEAKRNTGDTRGIGTIKYIQANGKYKKYLNKNCRYAVAWFDESSFLLKQICKFK